MQSQPTIEVVGGGINLLIANIQILQTKNKLDICQISVQRGFKRK